MKYYILSNATDEKEIGSTYPQCKGVPDGYSFDWYDKPNSMTKLTNKFFPKQNPDLVFELDEKAILTDIVSPSNISAKGFLLNEKTKNLLSDFNIIEHEFYRATIFAKGYAHKYFWLHLVKDNFDGVDFEQSDFIEANLMNRKIKSLNINSLENYNTCRLNKEKKFNGIIAEKLVLKKHYKLDLFFFPFIHDYLIVSQLLLNSLMKNKITGVKYKEATFIL
jgi:hypothetical protein